MVEKYASGFSGNWETLVDEGRIIGLIKTRGTPDDTLIKIDGNFESDAERQQFIGFLLHRLNDT